MSFFTTGMMKLWLSQANAHTVRKMLMGRVKAISVANGITMKVIVVVAQPFVIMRVECGNKGGLK